MSGTQITKKRAANSMTMISWPVRCVVSVMAESLMSVMPMPDKYAIIRAMALET